MKNTALQRNERRKPVNLLQVLTTRTRKTTTKRLRPTTRIEAALLLLRGWSILDGVTAGGLEAGHGQH